MRHRRSVKSLAPRLMLLACASCAGIGLHSAVSAAEQDPFSWLEIVHGERALSWVREQDARSLPRLKSDPRYERYYGEALAINQDKSRIPTGTLHDGWIYNFWQDEAHVRGVWRRTRLESYRTRAPDWQSLLDVDALTKAEGRSWVYKGATCLPPRGLRCLIKLSDGGTDASVWRELDVESHAFVRGGFVLPEAKSDVAWQDENTLLVSTDWGPGSMTASGYPFIVKAWRRGEPLSAARELFRGKQQDVAVAPARLDGDDGERLLLIDTDDTFFTGTFWLLRDGGKPQLVTVPRKASLQGLYRGELIFLTLEEWTLGKHAHPAGSLLSMPVSQMTQPEPTVRVVIQPGPRDAIREAAVTRAGVLVASYSNVRGRASRFRLVGGTWRGEPIALPDQGTVTLETADPLSTTAFLSYQNFLEPTTLYALDVESKRMTPVKSLEPKFDASRHVVEQLEASSRDGTRVPYFLVRPKSLQANGRTPLLLSAYGGFGVSVLPTYSATLGRLWLDRGGAYAIANIRGGGEFGPAWHDAGLKTHRQVVYDDFIAVAEDLIQRKITSPAKLGIRGGSNGGLLMGVMLTQRPELFHAVAMRSPLLDMLRYHELLAGASWVDEYGSPDVPQERAWLERLSPYRNLTPRPDFPVPFLITSTKDDRVHPAHARKYAAKLESLGMPYFYYENLEGGHSAAADLRQQAQREALELVYFAQQLM